MIKLGRGGFTIIEVLLFLSIAGLMMIVAITSIGSRNQRVQFTDGMRAAEIGLERKYSEIRNGSLDGRVNCQFDEGTGDFILDDPAFPSNGDCVFLGYIFELPDFVTIGHGVNGRSTLIAHQVIGKRITSVHRENCEENGIYSILCAQPVLSGVTHEIELPWGVEVHGAYGQGASRWSTFAFGFIRKPTSTSIVTTTFITTQGNSATSMPDWKNDIDELQDLFDTSENNIDNGGSRESFVEEGQETNICMQSGDGKQFASLSVANGFRNESVEINFEDNPSYKVNCLVDYAP